MKPQKMNDTQMQGVVRAAVDAAVSYCESEVAEDRIRAQKFFDGKVELETEDGRSQVIATKCRDAVRMVKPALMKVFLQETPVEFVPRGPEDVQAAEHATAYAEYKFRASKGFQLLSDVFQDALVKKVGILKAYWDEAEETEIDEYSNLVPEQMALLQQDPEVQILEQTQNEQGLIDARVAKTKRSGDLKICAIPPEDFFVDSGATSVRDSYICGDRTEMRVGDLVNLGFDFEEIFNLAGDADGDVSEEEQLTRNEYDDGDYDSDHGDPSMRKVLVTEAYMKMDIEGTGVPRMYQFICGGTNYKVLDYSLCDQVPYAAFEIDPQPHEFFGSSLVDILIDDQNAATSLLRGLLDNMHMVNNPRLVFNPTQTNTDDVLNNEIAALIRTKADVPANAVHPLVTPFTAGATLPALQYYDMLLEGKTGITRAASGLDTDSLVNTSATAVNLAAQAASAAAELMARNLAEGGMSDLFRIIAKLTRQHANPEEMMRLNGQFVPVNPASWNTGMDISVNVGLGNAGRDQKIAALQQVLADQSGIIQMFGPQNPMVTLTQARNTRADLLELAGIHDSGRYYNPLNPEIEAQIHQQAQAAQGEQQQSDPNAAFMQAEQMKAQQRAQEAQMNNQRDMTRLYMEDDRKRDEMAQKRVLEAAKLQAETGLQINQQAILAEQNEPRQ